MKGENMMDDNSIDYKALVESDVYKTEYSRLSEQLKHVDLSQLLDKDDTVNDDHLKAFFINIYNSLAIHSLAHLSAQSDISGSLLNQLDGKFWARMAYIIGDKNQKFSLDDIEHGVLRGIEIQIFFNKLYEFY